MTKITKHANKRRKERVHINKEGFKHLVEKAINEGICASQVKGRIKKYLQFLFQSHDNHANNIRLYGEFIYVLSNETLITVLHLPLEYRNYRKYLK